MTTVSTAGLQLLSTVNLQAEQLSLATLNEQLASGRQHNNLTDYAPSSARQLMNLQNAITQREAYIDSLRTVKTRLDLYDQTMSDMEGIAAQAATLAAQNQTLSGSQTGSIAQQVKTYMQQVVGDLNQKMGNRFVYAGTRYSTQPVTDADSILALATPSTSFTPVNNTVLPDYDVDEPTSTPTQISSAWTNDSAQIDTTNTLTYGVTSTQDGFQRLFAGLRLMYAATQTTDAATYQTNMNSASTILHQALSDIQTLHSGVAGATNTVTQTLKAQNTNIDNLKNQIGDIQNVDLTEIGTSINVLQSQLQASYSATANLTSLSILKYL